MYMYRTAYLLKHDVILECRFKSLPELPSPFPYSADPLSNLSVPFDSMEEAIAYAVKNGKCCVISRHSED